MASTSQSSPAKAARRRPRWGWIVLVVLVAAAGAYAFIARPWETRPAAVATETVESGPFTQALAVNGRVIARETIRVRSAVSGIALEVRAEEGAAVTAGDMLVQLDTAQPRALVDQARAALDAGMAKQQQAQASSERAQALGENTPRSSREDAELALTAANNEVARLRAALDQAQSQLDQYTIDVPLDGVVLDRAVDRGQLVDTQTELFTIADLSNLLVETDVDEIYSSRIQEGLPVLLRPAGYTVSLPGSVAFASPSVDPSTGGRAVKIAFDEPVELPVGLTVNANIIVSQTEAALSIPRGAIVTEGAHSHVLVLVAGVVEARPVEFSDWPAERVIVIDGLAEGDVVILDPGAIEVGQKAVAN